MNKLKVVEIKAFVPSRDFDLSQKFYQDLGFKVAWSDESVAYVKFGETSFLLHKFYIKEHADNFMMHLLVEDVDAWWKHVLEKKIASRYGVESEPPTDRPWRIRDFVIADPTGVLWRIGQKI